MTRRKGQGKVASLNGSKIITAFLQAIKDAGGDEADALSFADDKRLKRQVGRLIFCRYHLPTGDHGSLGKFGTEW
ncbi:MAG: hypothetical protein WC528_03670 [Patescibacteria group bacterium]